MSMCDAIIVGGGPAGSSCAIHLASKGYKVLIIDKDSFPRHKACGDILMPDAMAVLLHCNMLEEIESRAFRFNSIRIYSPSLSFFDLNGRFLAISRKLFDALLMKRALEKGAHFLNGCVESIEQENSYANVKIAGIKDSLSCRVCVIATGAAVDLSRKSGLVNGDGVTAIALSCYVKSKIEENIALAFYDPALLPGYSWIFPLGNGLYNVGCGTKIKKGQSHANLKKELQSFLSSFPPAKQLMSAGRIVSRMQGAALRMNLDGNNAFVNRRVIAIGETIGTTLPLSGEGIGKAMTSALIAGESIDLALKIDDIELLGEFSYRLKRELKPLYSFFQNAEGLFYRQWTTEIVVRAIASSSIMKRMVERQISAIV